MNWENKNEEIMKSDVKTVEENFLFIIVEDESYKSFLNFTTFKIPTLPY